jgi:hypothetical protein
VDKRDPEIISIIEALLQSIETPSKSVQREVFYFGAINYG